MAWPFLKHAVSKIFYFVTYVTIHIIVFLQFCRRKLIMTNYMKRDILKIDEELCNGCGQCVPNCHEGALQVIDGKVRLVSELMCDGLGSCIGHCPEGAITIEIREAEQYNEARVTEQASELRQWPVQLALLNSAAPYFDNADLLVSADCVPFAYSGFHEEFLKGKILIIFCPKLDADIEGYITKLAAIFSQHTIRSITLLHMEVPCCGGVRYVIDKALAKAGVTIPVEEKTITIEGTVR